MSDVLLQMWAPQRKYIIESHQFYVEQAKVRLLSAFDNIEQESEKYADEWVEKNSSKYFDPDVDDPAEIYEQANDEMVDFYLNLEDLHKNVVFSIAAGMYHKWEKELREWLIHEMRHWKGYRELREKIWHLKIKQILDFFKDFGWDVYSESFFAKLDTCRIIVNVYKHGNGNSFNELKQKYPHSIIDPLASKFNSTINFNYLDYTNVVLTDEDLNNFANAITNFWSRVPEIFFMKNVINIPDWLKNKI